MDITWLGYGSFRLRGKNASAILDPYSPTLGMRISRQEATIVTLSDPKSPDLSEDQISESKFTVKGPGEYEIGGITVVGRPGWDLKNPGKEKSSIYLVTVDDVNILHLGAISKAPPAEALEDFDTVDVLLLPVGGGASLNAEAAAALAREIEPRLIIPMRYSQTGLKTKLDPLENFLKEMGISSQDSMPKLQVLASDKSEDSLKVVILDSKP